MPRSPVESGRLPRPRYAAGCEPGFRLQFDPALLPSLATKYDYPDEARLIREVATPARARGWFTADEFIDLVHWKTGGRSVPLVLRNDRNDIEQATRVGARPEDARAAAGTCYPVASCVLRFAHQDPYPILDIRALQSLGYRTQRTVYSDTFWQDYVAACRVLARQHGMSMRDLDRALWAWPTARRR